MHAYINKMGKIRAYVLATVILMGIFFFAARTHAQTGYLVYGTNFEFYFEAPSSFGFQHLYEPGLRSALEILVNVTSGTVNGTATSLRMNMDGGRLRFTSEDNCSITSQNGKIFVNDVRLYSPSVVVGDVVVIMWGLTVWSPVGLILGLIGLGLFIVTPVYTVYEVKQKKNYIWIVYCLALFSLAYAFTTSWFQ